MVGRPGLKIKFAVLLLLFIFQLGCNSDDPADVKETGSIKLTVEWDTAVIAKPEINGTLVMNDKTVDEFTLTDGDSIYENSSLSVGTYTLTVNLYDANEDNIGQATQQITISTGALTETKISVDVTIPEAAPVAPSSLVAVSSGSTGITLTWTDNSDDETGFRIERALDVSGSPGTYSVAGTVTANAVSFADSSLEASTKYYYRVYAYNSIGDSSSSNVANATTDAVLVAPAAPGSLSASVQSYSRIALTWTDNSDNETGFRVERAPDVSGNPGTFSEISTLSANTSSYTNTDLTELTKYHYRVCAYNSLGNSPYSNTVSATTTEKPASATQIIADHTVVDLYDDIPQEYIDIVKTWLVDIAGESHSSGYRIGVNLLETIDPKFQVETFDGSIPAVTSSALRLGRHGSVGEANFYTNTAAITAIKNKITTQHDAANPIHVIGFGWCWDMTWHNSPGGTIDPVYGVHWAGSSEGGPEGDLRWGLDSGDQALTGNSVCMDTYLNAVIEYIQHCETNGYVCKPIFTTGPVDGNGGTENGYQREIKHQYIRDFVSEDGERILFDYADILCWSNAGVQNTVTWDGHVYPQIHSDNMLDVDGSYAEDGDHIGQRGSIRLAKAMWWMLARMAGWDGN